jgi:Uma2 family endonuclease
MHVMETLSAWSRALRDASLRDLPYKVETNEYGQLVLSPQRPRHGAMQARISDLLRDHLGDAGIRAVEYAVQTSKGVKLPDVVWTSEERRRTIPDDAEASPVAPEICIEVLSPGNTPAEIDEKRRLYFERGAHEVWVCDVHGRMRFFTPSGEQPSSELVASFPAAID